MAVEAFQSSYLRGSLGWQVMSGADHGKCNGVGWHMIVVPMAPLQVYKNHSCPVRVSLCKPLKPTSSSIFIPPAFLSSFTTKIGQQ